MISGVPGRSLATNGLFLGRLRYRRGIDEKNDSGPVAGSPQRGQTRLELINCVPVTLV
jgi:hypothetical protein